MRTMTSGVAGLHRRDMTCRALCSAIALFGVWLASAAQAFDFNGWWEVPGQPGSGVNVGQQGSTLFIAWYTYDETGRATWLNTGGPMTSPTTFTAPLYRHTGPKLGTVFNPTQVAEMTVGSTTLTFTDLHHATFAWTFNGKSGTLPLQRESYGGTNPDGRYDGTEGAAAKTSATPECVYMGSTAPRQSNFTISVDTGASTLTINQSDASIFQGAFELSGEWLHVPSGTYTSTESYGGGTFTASILPIDRKTIVELTLSPSGLPGCVVAKTLTGFH